MFKKFDKDKYEVYCTYLNYEIALNDFNMKYDKGENVILVTSDLIK